DLARPHAFRLGAQPLARRHCQGHNRRADHREPGSLERILPEATRSGAAAEYFPVSAAARPQQLPKGQASPGAAMPVFFSCQVWLPCALVSPVRPAAGTNVVASALARDKQEGSSGGREPLPQVPIFLNSRQRLLE